MDSLDQVPYVHCPVNVYEKLILLPVIPSYERRDPFTVLDVPDVPPRRQHTCILEPLGVEARKPEIGNPKLVPLVQNEVSG